MSKHQSSTDASIIFQEEIKEEEEAIIKQIIEQKMDIRYCKCLIQSVKISSRVGGGGGG